MCPTLKRSSSSVSQPESSQQKKQHTQHQTNPLVDAVMPLMTPDHGHPEMDKSNSLTQEESGSPHSNGAKKERTGLMDIPPELRDMIYGYCLHWPHAWGHTGKIIIGDDSKLRFEEHTFIGVTAENIPDLIQTRAEEHLRILQLNTLGLVSKQLREESRKCFYSGNNFFIFSEKDRGPLHFRTVTPSPSPEGFVRLIKEDGRANLRSLYLGSGEVLLADSIGRELVDILNGCPKLQYLSIMVDLVGWNRRELEARPQTRFYPTIDLTTLPALFEPLKRLGVIRLTVKPMVSDGLLPINAPQGLGSYPRETINEYWQESKEELREALTDGFMKVSPETKVVVEDVTYYLDYIAHTGIWPDWTP